MKWIKNLIKSVAWMIKKDSYQDGYEYACAEIVKRSQIQDLYEVIFHINQRSKECLNFNDFDKGVISACTDFLNLMRDYKYSKLEYSEDHPLGNCSKSNGRHVLEVGPDTAKCKHCNKIFD